MTVGSRKSLLFWCLPYTGTISTIYYCTKHHVYYVQWYSKMAAIKPWRQNHTHWKWSVGTISRHYASRRSRRREISNKRKADRVCVCVCIDLRGRGMGNGARAHNHFCVIPEVDPRYGSRHPANQDWMRFLLARWTIKVACPLACPWLYFSHTSTVNCRTRNVHMHVHVAVFTKKSLSIGLREPFTTTSLHWEIALSLDGADIALKYFTPSCPD